MKLKELLKKIHRVPKSKNVLCFELKLLQQFNFSTLNYLCKPRDVICKAITERPVGTK